MKYFLLIMIALISVFEITAQPHPNPYLDKYVSQLPEEKLKYLPLFLMHFDPEDLIKFNEEKTRALILDSLNYFIADSARYYDKILEPDLATQIITPEVLVSLKRMGNPVISPDGTRVMFTITTPDIRENKSNTDIYFHELKSYGTFHIVIDPKSDYEPNWTPDGKSIAFISTRSGSPQIFSADTLGRDQKQITKIENGVSNLAISPNGQYYSYTSDVKIDQTAADKYPSLSKATVRIYKDLPVRHWDEWEDENYSHLFILPVEGKESIDVMPGEKYDTPLKPFGGISEIAWSPDSKEIAYSCKKVKDYVLSTNSDIYIYNLETKQTKNITEGMEGYDKDPLYSPDGKWIAFHSQKRAGFESDRIRLMLYDRDNGKISELSETLDQWVGEMVWSPDSKTIYFSAEAGAVVQLYKIDVPSGQWKLITQGKMNCDGGTQITPDGKSLIFGGRNMMMPTELYSISVNGENLRKRTFINEEVLRQLKKIDTRVRLIKNEDGENIHTWVLYPPDFDSTKQYPMITYCQGGPQSTISQYFSFRWNLYTFASHGYIVVAPNRRGVPGFGQKWNDAISKDWGGAAMNDILAATDAIAKEPYVKKNGIAAVGASAGGYATFWLEGNHNKRFSAFVSHSGVFDVVSKYGSTDEIFFPNWEFGGPYWEKEHKKNFEKNSPHMYADKWDTPILISAGEKDFRVPYTQSLEAFTLAQLKGIPSELIIFPNENHWILKPQEQILWYHEVFDFLDKYCKQ